MKLTDDEKRLWAVAQDRSSKGDLAGTIELLRDLVSVRSESALFNAVFANAVNEQGDTELAQTHFMTAARLDPACEAYSLGLFHCLWSAGKREEALNEAARFTALADSEEYRGIVSEINRE